MVPAGKMLGGKMKRMELLSTPLGQMPRAASCFYRFYIYWGRSNGSALRNLRPLLKPDSPPVPQVAGRPDPSLSRQKVADQGTDSPDAGLSGFQQQPSSWRPQEDDQNTGEQARRYYKALLGAGFSVMGEHGHGLA